MTSSLVPCRICGKLAEYRGSKPSRSHSRVFHLYSCPDCRFSFFPDPLDPELVYNEEYYAGRGIDPFVDYEFETAYPDRTIRLYEWRGIAELVQSLVPVTPSTEWLDFGCGNAGLVRYVRGRNLCRMSGFDVGWIRTRVPSGISLLHDEDLLSRRGQFDVITAIEVLEHVDDPMAVLRQIRQLLKPGGLFFFTTGNAQPFRGRMLSWRYLIPEIHVSFFEPATLELALARTGFRPDYRGHLPGWNEIIRFKALKNLRLRRRSTLERSLPWPVLSRTADAVWKFTAHPIGWAE